MADGDRKHQPFEYDLDVCPACVAKRRHIPEDWKYHPLAGHGITKENGPSHPALGGGQ